MHAYFLFFFRQGNQIGLKIIKYDYNENKMKQPLSTKNAHFFLIATGYFWIYSDLATGVAFGLSGRIPML